MRAYRRRVAEKRNVTPGGEPPEPSAALREENRRLRRLLAEAQQQIPDAEVTFPIAVTIGRWVKISSTSALRPGVIIRPRDDEESDHLVLEKTGHVLQLQALQDGTVGTLSIYDAKANWKSNTRACLPKLLKKWRAEKDGKRNVTDWEAEAKRLKEEVRRLSKQVTALSRSNYSMAISIDKGMHGNYVARHLNGNEWAQGKTPMEAFGELVFSHANARVVTVESVEFGY